MSGDPRTQAVAGALSLLVGLAKHRAGLQQQQAMAQLQSSALKDMVEAVVTRRVDAIENQCRTVLTLYADQASAYISESKIITEKMLETRDLIRRTEYRSRLSEIDTKLADIRADAKLLYDRMAELIISVGGPGINFAGNLSMPLQLPN